MEEDAFACPGRGWGVRERRAPAPAHPPPRLGQAHSAARKAGKKKEKGAGGVGLPQQAAPTLPTAAAGEGGAGGPFSRGGGLLGVESCARLRAPAAPSV
jgi:hypothetical protein